MIQTPIHKTALAIVCLITMTGIASADTKVKSRQTSGGQTYENTSYIKGKRQRTETNNGQMIVLQQCDLRRNVTIMPQAQAYMIQPYDTPNTTSTSPSASNSQPSATTKGGVITSTVTTKDTGERKQMFGYTARHIVTTMEMESSPEACTQTKTKMQIDGWYVDAEFAIDCDSGVTYRPYTPPNGGGGCQDRYVTKQVGTAKKGYPVWEKTTMFDQSGAESFSTINEVLEFSHATLDATLFDVPAGYRQVNDFASAFSAPSTTAPANTDEKKSVSSEPETKPEPKPEAKPKSDPVKKINRALRWP
ncbi:MAG TPA: hypothetical protein VHQ94_22950 [Pyrinomonadaceae bacterium]|jgi:hypothetical protein|nr:hypothetical protein [Pyrinomonadaceae bacterium]